MKQENGRKGKGGQLTGGLGPRGQGTGEHLSKDKELVSRRRTGSTKTENWRTGRRRTGNRETENRKTEEEEAG